MTKYEFHHNDAAKPKLLSRIRLGGKFWMRSSLGVSFVAAAIAGATPCDVAFGGCSPNGKFDPTNPTTSGYQQAFSDDFNSPSTIDLKATGAPGYKWYTTPFFGGSPTPASQISVANGVLSITPGSQQTGNWNLATAAPANNANGFVGNVFGGGGYFEAAIKIYPDQIPALAGNPTQKDLSKGWPSFWSFAIEHATHNATNADQWPGQANGFQHYIEADFFEFDTNWAWDRTYGGMLHDWYGVYLKTCPGTVCQVANGGSGTKYNNFVVDPDKRAMSGGKIDWGQFHTFGLLWVKGDASNNYTGYAQYYFDGYPTNDYVSWKTPPANLTPSQLPNSAYGFGVLDSQRLLVILGSGVNQRMDVDFVRVWRLPACS